MRWAIAGRCEITRVGRSRRSTAISESSPGAARALLNQPPGSTWPVTSSCNASKRIVIESAGGSFSTGFWQTEVSADDMGAGQHDVRPDQKRTTRQVIRGRVRSQPADNGTRAQIGHVVSAYHFSTTFRLAATVP